MYHFEGFGGELPHRSPIRLAFERTLRAQSWQIVSVRDHYQSDGSSCGVWLKASMLKVPSFERHSSRQASLGTMLLLALGCSPLSRGTTEPLGSLLGAESWL